MDFKTNDIIILTGAGFTKNFGGFLASEMWCKIFNNPLIQSNSKLRKILQNQFDFEAVYSEVDTSSDFGDEEKVLLRDSIENAYRELEYQIRGWEENGNNSLAFNTGKFFQLFSINCRDGFKNFCFTLNQDLFMERRGYIIPGLNKFSENELYHIEELKYIQLPDKDNLLKMYDEIKGMASVIYIKLHGSYGWLSYDSKKTAMIIGKNKPEDIEKEPLLKEYWKIFNDSIAQGNKKILIIGYGFGDKHINKILEEGVENYGLQIYIINNELPNKFTTKSIMHPDGPLWKGVKGYFPYLLKDICPLGGQETSYFKEIKNALLN